MCLLWSFVALAQENSDAAAPETDTTSEPTIQQLFGSGQNCDYYIEPGTTDFDISAAASPVEGIQFPGGAVIGNIVYTRYPIFDVNNPKENNRLFRAVDYLHIDTRPWVIEDQLLFETGDPLNMRVVEEAARSLRESDYLYDARIWPYRQCGDRVDVEVLTREVWTLSGGVSLSRRGGAEDDRVSISDSNFLGRGERVTLAATSNIDRSGLQFIYGDPNLFGSRHTLELEYADNDDGQVAGVELMRPFFSLDTHFSWGLEYNDVEQVEDLYDRGEEIASYRAHYQESEIFLGTSRGWVDGITRRWRFGLFAYEEMFSLAPGEPVPPEFPRDREINYPFLEYSRIEEDFIQVSNLNQIHRIEDFNLGLTWRARLGIAPESFGSDTDRLALGYEVRKAWRLNEHTLTQLTLDISGFWQYQEDQGEEVLSTVSWRYYNGVGKKHGTYLAADLRYGRKLPPNQQILLGAEENLRGYPARYQAGDRSFIVSAEHRYYTDWHLFQLVRVGGAVFVDVGRAWESGDPNEDATGILADAGFGLRLSSSRAETKRVLHIDFAFPLKKLDDVDSMEVLVTAKQSF